MLDTNSLKSEFNLQNLRIRHEDTTLFTSSQWQASPSKRCLPFIIYKWILAILFTATLTSSMTHHIIHAKESNGPLTFYFLKLTNWGNVLNTMYGIMGALVVTLIRDSDNRDKLRHRQQFPVTIKFYWLLNIICTTNAIIVTTLYWSLVYNKGDVPDDVDLNNILTHACNSIFLVFDLMVTSIPIRLVHVVYPFMYELIYTLFTVVYYLCGGLNILGQPYIYKALDWRNTRKSTINTVGAFVYLFIVYFILYCLYKCRLFLAQNKKACCEDEDSEVNQKINIEG